MVGLAHHIRAQFQFSFSAKTECKILQKVQKILSQVQKNVLPSLILKNGWGSMSYDSKATGKRQKEFIQKE